jgi:Secretion system C-terminal sorting domain
MKKIYLLTVAMLFACFALASAQATLKTHGLSPREAEEDTTDIFEHAYNSLLNVGVGTVMYFEGSDSTVSSASFSVTTKPGTSSADITETESLDDETMIGVFVPDVAGTYVIQFSSNGSDASLTVNAGTYVTVDNCALCHNTAQWDFKVDEWEETGHASMLQRGLDGILSDHYGESCISCHTTGFDAIAENGGFDDFDFVFPDSLYDGAYDKAVADYPDAMKLANIQCESCHGPGSGHFGNKLESRIEASLDVNVCAICHDEGSHHAFPDQWRHAGEDATEFDGRGFDGGHSKGAFMARGATASCAPCHSGAGYIEWVDEGRPVDSYGLPASISNVPVPTLISCAVCHDPHDATNEHQLRLADTQLGDGTLVTTEKYGTGALCMHCHRSRREAASYTEDPDNASSHYGAHHGPEADLLLGVNAPDFGVELPSSPHAVAIVPGEDHTNACVNCHMAGDLADADGNINHVGGHSWNMNDPEGNDHVEACAPCHGIIGESFKDKKYYVNGDADLDGNGVAEGLQLEVKGLLEELALLLPPVGESSVSLTDTSFSPEIFKAGYVYFWIEEDRSFGVHNPAFAVSLLKASIEAAGGSVSIGYPEVNGIPEKYTMSQNYPNPFNPSTRIDYTLTNSGHVNLTVYNALGQIVATLINTEMTAGQHTIDFDASNLTSGIYFYRIQVTNGNGLQYQAINKMILMK